MDVPDPRLGALPLGTVFAVLVVMAAGCGSGGHAASVPDAAVDAGMEAAVEAPGDACSADGPGGGGQCPINVCGEVRSVASLSLGQVASTGADALCTPPYACVPAGPSPAGNTVDLRCVSPRAGAAAFGEACVTDGAGARCRDDSLCIEAPTAPGAPFCTTLCRADTDCPANAYCLEYPSATPDGSHANLGMCTPATKIGATPCAREADCQANEGCVPYGARADLFVCKAASGTKSLGTACASSAECRSGECLDHDGHFAGTQNRAFCAGVCGKNSDCGPDQRCVRLVLSNNGTPDDPTDDVVSGYCRTLYVALASQGCAADADCVARADGSDTCQKTYGACYKSSAPTGAPCAGDGACDLGATCVTGPRFPGGYCQTTGCAPGAASGVDACPGPTAVCSQRASDQPIRACYEGCAQASDCSRFGAGYDCELPEPGAATMICIGAGRN
jgi:hypothetical protein